METGRLFLREITIEDTNEIVKWRSDPEAYKYFLNPHRITKEEHKDWFLSRYLFDDTRTDYIAEIKGTNVKIGVFGIVIDSNYDEVEINYLIDGDYRGKGFAKEAVICLLNYAKIEKGCKIAIAEIHKENINSIMLAKSLGFYKERKNGEFFVFKKKL